jgi:hypothetical protein
MKPAKSFHLTLDAEVLDRLDAFRASRGLSRSAAVALLVEVGVEVASVPATREEALGMLSESARAGSVAARVQLARLLVSAPPVDPIQRRRVELAAKRQARGIV